MMGFFSKGVSMISLTALLVVFTVIMLAVAWQAHQLGNERCDVALLAVLAGVLGAGAAVSATA